MNCYILTLLVPVLIIAVTAEEMQIAEPCDQDHCKLPICRCSNTDIPGQFSREDVPQFVLLTFDDAVTISNINTYRDLLENRKNSNNCPAGATFYVSHEYTNYHYVNELYNMGLEIALHSISHQASQTYWAEASYDHMVKEFADQVTLMSYFANIPASAMKGLRMPFLQLSGNSTPHVMKDYGLEYDCSWPSTESLWPYTLEYASTQQCVVPPCPTASFPDVWIHPMVNWIDLSGYPCAMVDSCFHVPGSYDVDGWFFFFMKNFYRHYYGNRTPFPLFMHEWFLRVNPSALAALIRFLDFINTRNDIFMVNTSDVIQWIRNPVPVKEYATKPCKQHTPTNCVKQFCGPLTSDHNAMSYWMAVCNDCPKIYPWVGNPLGV